MSKVVAFLKHYNKTIAAVGGLIVVVASAAADGSVTGPEWGAILGAAAAVIGVNRVANGPKPE